jgi:catechol 2,3-dioxygenase-like lactoylglutathione lyase family enzyme
MSSPTISPGDHRDDRAPLATTVASALGASRVMAFVATADAARSRAFYGDVLGLRLVGDEAFALLFESGGTTLRVQKVARVTPPQYTVLGWSVSDIAATMERLRAGGVLFESFGLPGQDASGLWTAEDGTRVAWFKDPDGNLLSLTQG